MIAIKTYRESIKSKGILLLDDILLDLDATKKNYFLNLVKEHQCFFTSTNTYGVGDISKFATESRMFTVNAGQISVE
jgi:recombinational DNA repair ATPase RecF